MNPPSHRQWAVPQRPWAMSMRWEDLLFIHWPIALSTMREVVPPGLEVETFDGTAWIGVVPFRMTRVRHRLFPPLPGLSAFSELNVRTYVTVHDKPGVYFFSLDAASKVAVRVARWTFHLQYFDAKMKCATNDSRVHYECRRVHRGAPPAEFAAQYQPIGDTFHPPPGSRERFLTDRYCLYAVDRRGKIWRGDIDHAPWPLQLAQAEIRTNTMLDQLRMHVPDAPPLLHFAKCMDVVAWRPTQV